MKSSVKKLINTRMNKAFDLPYNTIPTLTVKVYPLEELQDDFSNNKNISVIMDTVVDKVEFINFSDLQTAFDYLEKYGDAVSHIYLHHTKKVEILFRDSIENIKIYSSGISDISDYTSEDLEYEVNNPHKFIYHLNLCKLKHNNQTRLRAVVPKSMAYDILLHLFNLEE